MKKRKIKPFEKLCFHDDFMFGIVMQDKDICTRALECMLGMKIKRIRLVEPQKSVIPLYTSRSIRLDVYVQDSKTVCDVEIQNRNTHDMGRRTRYYQSMMDADSLLKGKSCKQLKDSIIIFLCRFDPFKKQIPCYTVKRVCTQNADVDIDDGATVQIFNCKAFTKIKDENLRAFLKYVQTSKAESDFTRRVDDMVKAQKKIEGLKKTYLSWSLHDYDVRNEGIAIGEKRGKAEGMKLGKEEGIKLGKSEGETTRATAAAKNLLAMKVLTDEQIARAVGLPLEKVEKLAAEISQSASSCSD